MPLWPTFYMESNNLSSKWISHIYTFNNMDDDNNDKIIIYIYI